MESVKFFQFMLKKLEANMNDHLKQILERQDEICALLFTLVGDLSMHAPLKSHERDMFWNRLRSLEESIASQSIILEQEASSEEY